jgi:hypothetical protein
MLTIARKHKECSIKLLAGIEPKSHSIGCYLELGEQCHAFDIELSHWCWEGSVPVPICIRKTEISCQKWGLSGSILI